MLRTLLIFAALAPAAIAAPVVEQDAIPGLPAVQVQDLHYGDVLFYFYQQDHFDALVRLAAYRDQGKIATQARDSELLRGGLYLSLGQHREAREIFERLLADPSTPQDVRNQAWFWLGNLKAGDHEVTAFFTGQGPHDRDYKRGTTLKVEKGVGAKYVELKISDSVSQLQPEFVVRVWE